MKKRRVKCDFCENGDFENAIFVTNRLLKCDICEKCDFQSPNFCKKKSDFKNVNCAKNAIS